MIHQAQGTPTCSYPIHQAQGTPTCSYPIHQAQGTPTCSVLPHTPHMGRSDPHDGPIPFTRPRVHPPALTPYTRPRVPTPAVLPYTPDPGYTHLLCFTPYTRPRVHPPALSYPMHLTWDGVIPMTALYHSPDPGYTHLLCLTPYTRPRVPPPTLFYPTHQAAPYSKAPPLSDCLLLVCWHSGRVFPPPGGPWRTLPAAGTCGAPRPSFLF